MRKRILSILLTLCLCLGLLPAAVMAADTGSADEIVILYTNDVHTYINEDITYSKLAALKDTYENVLLLDAGDHIQGTAYGSMDKGETIVKLMNAVGYDAATLGNHEFDYGMSGCLQTVERADYTYLSCNFHHELDGVVGESVLDAYKVFEVDGTKIAVIGITTPETFTSSTPAYFQDENGNYIYGIAGGDDGAQLYAAVQSAIDAASQEADVIIALGHLGDDASSAPWRSEDVIANTTGLDAFIDGHSHSTVPMKAVTDQGGNTVILTQTGEYFGAVGKMTISADGITTELLTADALTEITPDAGVKAIEDAWITELESKLGQVIGSAEVTLDNYDTDGSRLVRVQETNTGDFTADALYYLFDNMGMDVDAAFMNGGGVRNKAVTGDISYETCKTIHTFGNVACLQTVTGQQLLDALEWGARTVGVSESGSFLQVSGLTYRIDTSIPDTNKVDDKGVWAGGPSGEYRVHDVKVYNKETGTWDDLDLSASYNLAGYNYTLRDLGDGFAMFAGSVNVLDYVMEDYMVLANYVQGFENGTVKANNSPLAAKYEGFAVDYGTVNGSGRIVVETPAPDKTYSIWVGGEQITSANISGEGWSYDAGTNTLTLDNYTYSGQGYKGAAIYAEGALNITLKGENQISSSGYYGICIKEAMLTISGDGTLDVEGTDFGIYTTKWDIGALTIGGDVTVNARSGDVVSGSSYGIRADGALTIRDNAVVTASSGYAPTRSCGIYAYTTLDICDNAAVTATGGSSTDGSVEVGSYGIRTTYMTVSGGTLTATGAAAKYDSCGIYTQTLEVSGGSVTAIGGTPSDGPSVGIQAVKSLDVSGGTLNATGGDASANGDTSCGIMTSGPMTVSGGTIIAKTGSGGYTRAIQADQMSVTGGTITAEASDAVLTSEEGAVSYSSGIQVFNGLTVEDGTITATGGNAANYSYGIQVGSDATVSGGKLVAKSGSAGRSYGFWAMGTVSVDNGTLTTTAGDAVSEGTAYSVGLCAFGGLSIDFGGSVDAAGGNATGRHAYSSGAEIHDDIVQVYDGFLIVNGGTAVATGDAGSVGISIVGGGIYTYENGAQIYANGGTAEATGKACVNGISVDEGDVGFEAGSVTVSAGVASGAVCDSYAVYVQAEEDADGSIIGGYLNIECDEVIFSTQGAPRLVGTSVTAKGPVFAEMGIYVGEKLTLKTPAGGAVTEVTGIDGSYYTIVEEDGATVAEQIEIKPLSYTVRIYAATTTMAVPVPAGQSVNETHCEALGIEDFSEAVNTAKEGYIFEGWYTDEAYTEAFDFDMAVTADITLYGKWTAITYTVTYVADGNVVATVTVEHGKDAAAPELPAKEGYTAAWDQDGKGITADTTITAVYTEIQDTPDVPDTPDTPDVPDTPDTPDTSDIPEIPQTSDKGNVGQWFILLCVSGGVLMVLLAQDRKKRLIK